MIERIGSNKKAFDVGREVGPKPCRGGLPATGLNSSLLRLQRTIGNRAVGQLLRNDESLAGSGGVAREPLLSPGRSGATPASPSALIQRHCGGPVGAFDLAASPIGGRIVTELGTVTVTVPSSRPGGRPTEQPRIAPAEVLELLALSPCFLHTAQQVEWLYFGRPRRGGGQDPPLRATPLEFHFHERPALGNRFLRAEDRILVHTTTLADVVQGIVHEMTHAGHEAPRPRGGPGIGDVTAVERGAVREEARTRVQENEIMAQIAGHSRWRALTGQGWSPNPDTGEEDVRDSFGSGLPLLTYQEDFITGEMLNRTRPAGIHEGLTRQAVLTLYNPGGSVRPENARSFRRTASEMTGHHGRATTPLPTAPPTYADAVAGAGVFRRHVPWRRALEREGQLPEEARRQLGAACVAFIEGYPTSAIYAPGRAYGRRWLHEPSERAAREQFFQEMHSAMRAAYDQAETAREESRLLDRWYRSVAPEQRTRALHYLEWQLIVETMSREWQSLGRPDPTPEVRRRHLDFLRARIGRPLQGISRRGL